MLNTFNHKDILVRAAKTFIASFLATFSAGLANVQSSFANGGLSAAKSAGVALVVAAGSAAVTAIINYAIQAAKA